MLNYKLKLFMVAMVLANMAWQMYGPILPLYLKELDASILQIGLFFTLSQIIPLALQIIGGWISDTLGRLRSIAMGSLAGVLSYVALLLAPTWQWVLLGEGFSAVTRSLVAPSFGAFIAEQSAEEHRARVFAITDTIYMIVMIVGPPLGGWMVDQFGFKWMLAAAGILYVGATIIRVSMARSVSREVTEKPETLSFKSLKTNLGLMVGLILGGGVVTWLLLTDGVRDLSGSMSFTLLPVYLQGIGGLSMTQIGWLSSILGIANMVMNIPGGTLADKKGERVAIALGFLIDFAALVVFLQVSSFWGYAAAWALFGVGGG
ncbi:MAG: MFS transporter, partial [Anaerolineaceae bacterium]|nr:MFS transporter [Anaerolineaceae bacterium]